VEVKQDQRRRQNKLPSGPETVGQTRGEAGPDQLLEPPSGAELTVLRLLATDLSARQIAEELFLSPNTVRSHTRSIYRKLGVSSREQAVARATALGLIGGTLPPLVG
jgi:ATP/maltotriose-dependent transcriptional regulator MalT